MLVRRRDTKLLSPIAGVIHGSLKTHHFVSRSNFKFKAVNVFDAPIALSLICVIRMMPNISIRNIQIALKNTYFGARSQNSTLQNTRTRFLNTVTRTGDATSGARVPHHELGLNPLIKSNVLERLFTDSPQS